MANQYYGSPNYGSPKQERSNTVWIVLGVILIVILLCCGGCTALFGLGLVAEDPEADSGDRRASEGRSTESTATPTGPSSSPTNQSPTDKQTSHPPGEVGNDTPREVFEGKRFVHDDFEAAPGWRVVEEEYSGATIENLKVANLGGDRRDAWLTFRFYDGKTVLAEVTCTSNQMQSGETSPMDCYSTEDFPTGYDAIKVSDAF